MDQYLSDKPIEVFISYSHKDERMRDEMVNHLANLKRQGMITAWHDRKISAGNEWSGEIDLHLNTASVILLLISANFMSSDYCNDVEVKRAMERHEAGDAKVIPVILRPVDWAHAPFSKLQALPKDGKPVSDWSNRDKAYLDIVKGIHNAIEGLGKTSTPDAPIHVTKGTSVPPDSATLVTNDKISIMSGQIQNTKDSRTYHRMPSSIAEALQSLATGDPILTSLAVGFLKSKPTHRNELLDVDGGIVTQAAIRAILASYPEASAGTILDRIKECDVTGDTRHRARRASELASPMLRPFLERDLVPLIDSGAEGSRHAIRAMGEIGAIIWYQTKLIHALNGGYPDKRLSYAEDAAARSFELATDTLDIRSGAELLISLATIHAEQASNRMFAVPRMQQCDLRHVDVITGTLLPSHNSKIISLSLDLLGDIGASRSALAILEAMLQADDEGLQREAALTIWRLCNQDVITEMRRRTSQSVALYGVEFGLDSVTDSDDFDMLLPDALETNRRYMVMRAIGLRHRSKYRSILRDALSSTDPLCRGCAALALARMGDSAGLQQSHFEAGDTRERTFTALALLAADATPFSQVETQLRQDLAEVSHRYFGELQWDILTVLSGCGSAEALSLARAWAPFYVAYARHALRSEAGVAA